MSDTNDQSVQSIKTLDGVSEKQAKYFSGIELETIYDLADAQLFLLAHNLKSDEDGLGGGEESADQYSLDPDSLDKPIGELDEPLKSVFGELGEGLELKTINEIGQWPPFLKARELVQTAMGTLDDDLEFESEDNDGTAKPEDNEPVERSSTDDSPVPNDDDKDAPPELLPVARDYATERLVYKALVLDEIKEPESRPLNGPVDLLDLVGSVGFTGIATGALLSYEQSWVPHGLSLGQLLHSLALAPGEHTNVAIIGWSRKESGQRGEETNQSEEANHGIDQRRSINETAGMVKNELQAGKSNISTNSESSQWGVSAGASAFGASVGVSYGESKSKTKGLSVTSSRGRRDISTNMLQEINGLTQQSASAVRNRRASVVTEVEQREDSKVKTRVVANYNHSHALSIHYYEVVQIYRVETRLSRCERCLFIPIKVLDFTNVALLRRYRGVLAENANDKTTHDLLKRFMARQVQLRWLAPLTSDNFDAVSNRLASRRLKRIEFRTFNDTAILRAKVEIRFADKNRPAMVRSIKPADGAHERGEVEFSQELVLEDLASISLREVPEKAAGDNFGVALYFGDSSESIQVVATAPNGGPMHWRLLELTPAKASDSQTLVDQIITLLNENALYYSQVIWSSLSEADIAMLFAGYTYEGAPLLERIDPQLLAIYGNYLVFRSPIELPGLPGVQTASLHVAPTSATLTLSEDTTDSSLGASASASSLEGLGSVSAEHSLDTPSGTIGMDTSGTTHQFEADDRFLEAAKNWSTWLQRNVDFDKVEYEMVPMGTGGTFAEAILGRYNASEKLDITRFWDWQESPIPLQATDIQAIQTNSRRSDSNLSSGKLESPMVNIVNPPNLPDPQSASLLASLNAAGGFRDMSGLSQLAALAGQGQKLTAQGAANASKQASEALKASADLEKARLATIQSAIAGQKGKLSEATNSRTGALINQGRKLDTAGAAASQPDSTASNQTDAFRSAIGADQPQLLLASTGGTSNTATVDPLSYAVSLINKTKHGKLITVSIMKGIVKAEKQAIGIWRMLGNMSSLLGASQGPYQLEVPTVRDAHNAFPKAVQAFAKKFGNPPSHSAARTDKNWSHFYATAVLALKVGVEATTFESKDTPQGKLNLALGIYKSAFHILAKFRKHIASKKTNKPTSNLTADEKRAVTWAMIEAEYSKSCYLLIDTSGSDVQIGGGLKMNPPRVVEPVAGIVDTLNYIWTALGKTPIKLQTKIQ